MKLKIGGLFGEEEGGGEEEEEVIFWEKFSVFLRMLSMVESKTKIHS